MQKLSSKRQVTLPRAVCNAIGLQPGDYVDIFARDGVVHVVALNSNRIVAKSPDPSGNEDSLTIESRAEHLQNQRLADQ